MLADDLERHGERISLVTEMGTTISYATLAELADCAGFGGGSRRLALIEMNNSPAAIAAYLGALRAGHAAILANAGNPVGFGELYDRYRPELIWTLADGLKVEAQEPRYHLHPDLCVMLSTSGTTGSAKLVRLSADAIDANASSIAEYLEIGPDERAITTLPPGYSYGLSVINSHLKSGGSLVLTDLSVTDDRFRALLYRHAVTSMAGVPYTYELLEASAQIEALPPSLRTLTQAGGRLPPDRVEHVRRAALRQNIRFFVMYGQTEATARMSYVPPEQLADWPDCIGRPIPGGQFALRDPESGAPAAEAGELIYRGPNVMMGYAEHRADLAKAAELEELATGDLAEVAASGIYRVVGRKSRFLKLLGLRISLDQVEREAEKRGWQIAATGNDEHLALATEQPGNLGGLAEDLARQFHLPSGMVVARSFDKLPRLETGKIDYRAILSAQPEAREDSRRTTEQEQQPLAAFAALLARLARKPRVDENASFHSIGGDSLNYIEASVLLERALGTLPRRWETMTLRDLATRTGTVDELTLASVNTSLDTHMIQVMRAIAILLIVAAHSYAVMEKAGTVPPASHGIFPFRHTNAVFVFVAGFLFQYLLDGFDYGQYLRVKLSTVVLPYCFVSIPAMLVYLLGLKSTVDLGAPAWIDNRVELTGYMLLTGTHLGPFWFMPMIVLLYIIAPLLKLIDDHRQAYWLILPMFLASLIAGRTSGDSDPVRAMIFYLPAYVIGMLASRNRDRLLPVLARFWPPLLLCALLPDVLGGGTKAHDELTLISKIIFSAGLLGVLHRWSHKVPNQIAQIGEISFGIYFVHGYIVATILLLALHFRLPLQGTMTVLAIFAVTVGGSVLVVLLARKMFGNRSRQLISA